MKIWQKVLAGWMVIGILGPGVASSGKEFRIDIRVFGIPMVQSIVRSGSNETGGIRGYSVEYNVTASFPDDIVLVRTDLDRDATEVQIKEAVYSHGYFKEAKSYLPSGIGWWKLGVYSFSCLQEELGTDTIRREYHEAAVSSQNMTRNEYWLTVRPKSADEKDAILGLMFESRWKTKEYPDGVSRVLLNQDVGIPLGQMLLVGFPSKDFGPRGTVYFLAVCVQKIEP
ncbi:MAG: hypothetical protein WCC06_00600 [Candidatus Aminicenantales bacterium]